MPQKDTSSGVGNKTSVTDSRGNTTYYTYNSNNWLISTTNAKGTVTYDYDNEGRLIRQTNTDGTVVVNTCDAVGNVISKTDENGEVTKFAYDAANRMISKTVVDGENEYTESYEYYPNGKIKKTTFADGTSESYTYDKQWRLVKTTDEQGNYSTSEYDAAAAGLLEKTEEYTNNVGYIRKAASACRRRRRYLYGLIIPLRGLQHFRAVVLHHPDDVLAESILKDTLRNVIFSPASVNPAIFHFLKIFCICFFLL